MPQTKLPTELDFVVTVHAAGVDPQLPVYAVEVSVKEGEWCETFATMDQLRAFLTGIKCASNLLKHVVFTPMLPSETQINYRLYKAPFRLWPEETPMED